MKKKIKYIIFGSFISKRGFTEVSQNRLIAKAILVLKLGDYFYYPYNAHATAVDA